MRAGGADITDIGAAFDQETRHQQFRAFIARNGDPAIDGLCCKRALDGRQNLRFCGVELGSIDIANSGDLFEPSGRAIDTHRC